MAAISLQTSIQLLTFNMVVQLPLHMHFAMEEAVHLVLKVHHLATRLAVMVTLVVLLTDLDTFMDLEVADLLGVADLLEEVVSADLLDHHLVALAAAEDLHQFLKVRSVVGFHLRVGHQAEQ